MRKFNSDSRKAFDGQKREYKNRRFNKNFDKNSPEPVGTSVVAREGESPESLIRRFKKLVELAGIMKELKRREFYMSPAQKRKDKQKKALKRARKEAAKEGRGVDR